MADDIRIKDLQSTASYMESDDYLGIDSLASGTRKINFAGLMDSEDDRLPTTDKTPRGAIDEHEGDISEIKQSLSYYKDCQSTFSNSAWQGVYYADYDISSIVNQGYKAIGIIPTDVNSNRPCYGYLYANGAMARVCTTSTDIGGTTVKFRVVFQKGESL